MDGFGGTTLDRGPIAGVQGQFRHRTGGRTQGKGGLEDLRMGSRGGGVASPIRMQSSECPQRRAQGVEG